ncbi:MAG: TnsA-like heteromeric transposase endonuclease subunit [Streptosporangiaceae bacterium]
MSKALSALPGQAPAGRPPVEFQIGYTTEDGARLRLPLANAAAVPFADMQPSRRIRARKGQRHLPGRWWSASDARQVGYESWLERDQVMWVDGDRAVTGIASQPFRLWWTTGQGEVRSHVPDYFADRADGPALVVDCRPADRRNPRDLAAFEATRRACGLAGWEYRLTGALDPVSTANLRWLSGYRHPRYGIPEAAEALRAAFAAPVPLMEGAEAAGDPLAVLPVVYHLLWRQELAADLSVPLHPATAVTLAAA